MESRRLPGTLVTAALAVLVALGLLGAATPPATATSAAPVIKVSTFTFDGVLRGYTTVVPASGGRGLPMIVFLGGTSAGTPSEIARDQLLSVVKAGQASLVYPIGRGNKWSVGPSCCTDNGPKSDDQGYVRATTRLAAAAIHPDGTRIYLMGYSAGAKLAWQLICARTGPFAALATYGGNPETTCPSHGTPLPVFIGFGAKDVNEPIAGRPNNKRGTHPPVVVNIDTWLARDGCNADRSHHQRLGSVLTITGWTPCARPGLTVRYGLWLQESHTLPQPPSVPLSDSFGLVGWGFVQKFVRK